MSKAVLIMDMPMNCCECPLHYKDEQIYMGNQMYKQTYSCRLTPIEIGGAYLEDIFEGKADWCPLKKLPEKQVRDYPEYDKYITGYDDGWDACIDEILGE